MNSDSSGSSADDSEESESEDKSEAEEDTDNACHMVPPSEQTDHFLQQLPEPEPPPSEALVRRNPTRTARPACVDVSDYALLCVDEMLPGRIPTDIAERLIAQDGLDIIRHPKDHPHM